MFRLFRWLIHGDGHVHQWDSVKTIDVYAHNNDDMPVQSKIILRCKHCGNIKKKTI